MDRYQRIASELLRALRGRRSQVAFARRLGFRRNVAHSWETGRNYPTAAKTLWIAKRVGIDVRSALQRFYRNPPAWLATVDAVSSAAIVQLLGDLRGRTPVVHVARVAGLSRFTVARALSGKAEPRLPDFLRIVEASSQRMLDLVAVLADPAKLPAIAQAWNELEAARRAAYDEPWTLAVVRTLELVAYRALPCHEPGWIAARLGIARELELRCIALLEQSGQIRMDGGHYRIVAQSAIDTRRDPERARSLRRWWSERALERFGEGEQRIFSYNVFSVSERDYERLRVLHRAYFQELRAIVAASQPVERVVLANVQLVALDRAMVDVDAASPRRT